jgi:hypothetical protein
MPKKKQATASSNIIKKSEFDRMVKEIRYWKEKLGMKDYDIYVKLGCDDIEAIANTSSSIPDKTIEINIAEDIDFSQYHDGYPEEVAAHEIFEGFISPISELVVEVMKGKLVTYRELCSARHYVINTLLNVLWREDFKNRNKSGRKKK